MRRHRCGWCGKRYWFSDGLMLHESIHRLERLRDYFKDEEDFWRMSAGYYEGGEP